MRTSALVRRRNTRVFLPDEGEGDPAAEEKEEPKKKKKICTIPPRVPPQYHSENGKVSSAGEMRMLG
jgi:hypothetical protein